MSNPEHLRILKSGVEKWNAWREGNPDVEPDLTGGDLQGLNLKGAFLQKVNFSGADIRGTDFMGAYLQDTNFRGVKAGPGKKAVFMSILVPLVTGIIMITLVRLSAIFVFSSILGGTLVISRTLASETLIIMAIVFWLSVVFFIKSISKKKYSSYMDMYFFIIALISVTALILAIFKSSTGSLAFAIVLSMLLIGIAVLIFVSVICSAVVTGKIGTMFAILVLFGSVISYFAPALYDNTQVFVEVGANRKVIAYAAIGVFAITLEVLEFAKWYLVRTEIMVLILIVSLSCYISWRTILEDKQFNVFRKIGISLGTHFGTNFQNAILSQADFSDAVLQGVRFNNNTVLAFIRWKNAKKLHLANFYGTPLEAVEVRNLLVSPEHNMNVDLNGFNLENNNLTGAYLRNADLRNSDLNGTVLSYADITGAKLFATSREDWENEELKCEYVYWDEEGKERTPSDRDFEPGEFEKLYKQLPTFDYFFQGNFTPIDMVIMDRVVQAINEKHPQFELTLDSFSSRSNPHAKFTVFHKEHTGTAYQEIKTQYEARIAALEHDKEKLFALTQSLVDNPHQINQYYMQQIEGDVIDIDAQKNVAYAKDQSKSEITDGE